MTLARLDSSRTSVIRLPSVIALALPFAGPAGSDSGGDRAVLVGVDAHEVAQPGDGDDLPVVLAEPEGAHRAVLLAGPGQQPHDQGDPGRVDVVDVGEVQHDRPGVAPYRRLVGGEQGLIGAEVDLAVQVDHPGAVVLAGLGPELSSGHLVPPSGA